MQTECQQMRPFLQPSFPNRLHFQNAFWECNEAAQIQYDLIPIDLGASDFIWALVGLLGELKLAFVDYVGRICFRLSDLVRSLENMWF